MVKFSLEARSALDSAHYDYDGFTVRELIDIKLLSIAAAAKHQATASTALQNFCSLSWPEITQCTSHENLYCLGLQPEHVFLLSQHSNNEHRILAANLATGAVVTDQSDSWVKLEMTGNRTQEVMERICPIDLSDTVFSEGSVARTSMEHLSVIVFRQADRWILMSPRSSAESFIHSIKQSAEFVI